MPFSRAGHRRRRPHPLADRREARGRGGRLLRAPRGGGAGARGGAGGPAGLAGGGVRRAPGARGAHLARLARRRRAPPLRRGPAAGGPGHLRRHLPGADAGRRPAGAGRGATSCSTSPAPCRGRCGPTTWASRCASPCAGTAAGCRWWGRGWCRRPSARPSTAARSSRPGDATARCSRALDAAAAAGRRRRRRGPVPRPPVASARPVPRHRRARPRGAWPCSSTRRWPTPWRPTPWPRGGTRRRRWGSPWRRACLDVLDDPAAAPEGVRRTTDDEGAAGRPPLAAARRRRGAAAGRRPLGAHLAGAPPRGRPAGHPPPAARPALQPSGGPGRRDRSDDDLLAGAEEGLYLAEASRGALDPLSGEFALHLPYGRRFRRGGARTRRSAPARCAAGWRTC